MYAKKIVPLQAEMCMCVRVGTRERKNIIKVAETTGTYKTMPPRMVGTKPRTWRERMMQRYGMDTSSMTGQRALTVPNWMVGKSMIFFFIAMFACWGVFGHVPEFGLWMVASISVVLFFYGGRTMSRSWEKAGEKRFLRNVFIAGFLARLIWVLYCYFVFNPEHFGNTFGDAADTDWYMNFGKGIAQWIRGESYDSLAQVRAVNLAAIDDMGYPMLLGIGYAIWGDWSDVFMPMMVKCIAGAYSAICIYRVAKRHFGVGTGRMAAVFVCLNPNMIYWCGNMFKEAEMVCICCIFVDEIDKALSSNKLGLRALLPGIMAGFSLFFFRAALGISSFLAVFGHIVFVSNKVLTNGKKIIAGILVGLTLLVGVGDSLRDKTEKIFETAQTTEAQKKNMEWRSEIKAGNKFAKYASAGIFAPLIFTIPFPTFNAAQEGQYLQIQLSGGSFVKNIFSFFVILVMFLMLISGEWRRHVFILAYTLGYLMVLVLSNFAQSGRFHMPIMPMLMLFAAYGVQMAKGNAKMRRGFTIVLILEIAVCIAWNWFKLAGRGLV